jgi:hypothetical protein
MPQTSPGQNAKGGVAAHVNKGYVGGGGSGGSSVSRKLLTADKTYFVQVGGIDSGEGPFATLTYALNYIGKSIDFQGFNVIINVGPGTFAGGTPGSMVGGGILQINGAGSALTILTLVPGTNGVLYSINSGMAIEFFVNGVTLITNGYSNAFRLFGAYGGFGDRITNGPTDIIIDTINALGSLIVIGDGALFTTWYGGGNIILRQNGRTFDGNIYVLDSFGCVRNYTSWILQGPADTISRFAWIRYFSYYYASGGTMTGAINCLRFELSRAGMVITSGQGLNYFPGTIPGTWDTTSNYDGVIGTGTGSEIVEDPNNPMSFGMIPNVR